MKTTDLIYTAGIFDGEGNIIIAISKRPNKTPQYWLQIGVTNTNRPLLEWLLDTFGGHISDNSSKKREAIKHRPCWAWRKNSNEAREFLSIILPYIRIKKQQAKLAIKFQDEIRKNKFGGRNKLTEKEIQNRQRYKEEISKLSMQKII